MDVDLLGRLPKSFYALSLSAFLFQLTVYIVRPIFTLYILELGATMFQVGLIVSIRSFLMMTSRIPLGILASKVGENKMLIAAFIVQSVSSVLYFLAPNPIWLYIIPFFEILGTGSFNQLCMSKVSNMAPSTRQGDALGRYMTLFSLGMFIGPVITSSLVTFIDYSRLYLVTAAFPVAGLLLFLITQSQLSPEVPESKNGETLDPEPDEEDTDMITSIKDVLLRRNVLVLSAIRAGYALTNTIFNTLFAVYAVQQLGYSDSLVALLFSLVGLANTIVKLPAGRLADRIGRKKVLLITFGIIILDYFAIAYMESLPLVAIALIIFGTCWGTRAVTEWSFLASTVEPEVKTIAMSYLSSFWGVGAIIGSMMAGLLPDIVPYSIIFVITAIINIPAIPLIYTMEREETI
ncbi:MAG: MFS transporter [Candidatus Bathyarchaeia archaeon]